jgi:hypothetical protein
MLTQAMPALVKALQGVLPPTAITQLTNALGNCQQPLEQRAPVNLTPTVNTNKDGTLNNQTWNPIDYQDLFNNVKNYIDQSVNYRAGDWNTTSYGGPTYDFRSTLNDYSNSYYQGPTIYNAGNSTFNDTYTNNSYVQNLYTVTINGNPAPGDPGAGGPPGMPGSGGPPGQNGANGDAGAAGAPGQPGAGGPPGQAGRDGVDGVNGLNGMNGMNGVNGVTAFIVRGRPDQQLVVTNVSTKRRAVDVVTGVTFDPDSCKLQFSTTTINDYQDITGEKQLLRFYTP